MLNNQLAYDFDELYSLDKGWIEFLNGSSVLVTGATGLLGSTIIKSVFYYNYKYSKNVKLIALARNEEKLKSVFSDYLNDKNFLYIIHDVNDKITDIDFKVDYIIHCANSTISMEYVKKPVETINTIINGTNNLLQYSLKSSVKSFVYLSSMEVYGAFEKLDNRVTENETGYIDTMSVRSSYSEGKRLAECICASYASEYGVNVKVARLAQVFGAGVDKNDNRVFMQLAKSVINKTDFVMRSDGSSSGNYCYVTDAIKGIMLLLSKGKSGEAYNIVNEENSVTIKEMANMVAKELANNGFKVIFDIPKSDLEFGYAPKTSIKLSSRKINELGWKPKVNLINMYSRMIKYLNYVN